VREFPGALRALIPLMFTSPTNGAQTSLYLAASPEVEGISGKYFRKKHVAHPPRCANDGASAQRLWQISEEMTALGQ
jgi:retinol dehydrogenase-12